MRLKVHRCLQASLPVLPCGRLLSHVVHHMHLLLIWSEHLEASTVAAQVVHGAEDRGGSYYLCMVMKNTCAELSRGDTHYTPSWTSVPSHHPHPEKTWNTSTNHNSANTCNLSIISSGPMLILIYAYHCNIGVSPIAIVTVVNKAGRLPRENSQSLF